MKMSRFVFTAVAAAAVVAVFLCMPSCVLARVAPVEEESLDILSRDSDIEPQCQRGKRFGGGCDPAPTGGDDPAPSGGDDPAPSSRCFPPYATIRTANSSSPVKTMKELNIGDKVLAVTSDGELVYSPVIAFSEWSPQNKENFVKLETEHGHVLTVTPVHVVFRKQSGNSSNEAVFASEIKPSDFLLTTDEFFSRKDEKDTVRMSKVTKASIIRTVGTYAPVTSEGTLVVDGVATSCYGVVKNHDLIHFFFAPLRFMNYFFPRVVGSEQEGTHWYSQFLLNVGEYASPFLFSKDELYHSY